MLQLSNWPYIKEITLSGELETDIVNLLTVNGKQETADHCLSVARQSRAIAGQFGLDPQLVSVPALLHDISNVMQPKDMLDYAIARNWQLDSAELQHPFLLHQRLSVEVARDYFKIDNPIQLAAIGCHSTLRANPTAYDMVLFLADKLAWDQAGIPPFHDLVTSALTRSLACAARTYIDFVLEHQMILTPHQWLIDAREWLDDQS